MRTHKSKADCSGFFWRLMLDVLHVWCDKECSIFSIHKDVDSSSRYLPNEALYLLFGVTCIDLGSMDTPLSVEPQLLKNI